MNARACVRAQTARRPSSTPARVRHPTGCWIRRGAKSLPRCRARARGEAPAPRCGSRARGEATCAEMWIASARRSPLRRGVDREREAKPLRRDADRERGSITKAASWRVIVRRLRGGRAFVIERWKPILRTAVRLDDRCRSITVGSYVHLCFAKLCGGIATAEVCSDHGRVREARRSVVRVRRPRSQHRRGARTRHAGEGAPRGRRRRPPGSDKSRRAPPRTPFTHDRASRLDSAEHVRRSSTCAMTPQAISREARVT